MIEAPTKTFPTPAQETEGIRGSHGDDWDIRQIPVTAIRTESGLGRRRYAEGHAELRRSVERFGVINPITVRKAEDGTDEFLLVKGQGRTLACRMLGIETIPAFVLGKNFSNRQKVQQFLVENVARLKMSPTDRALLVARARREGEETNSVARRFGLSTATVRRLEQQLQGATRPELLRLLHRVSGKDGRPPFSDLLTAQQDVVAAKSRRASKPKVLDRRPAVLASLRRAMSQSSSRP